MDSAFNPRGFYALLRNRSLLQHEKSNDIAQIVDSYKGQTVVCTLYGPGCCLLSCLHTATAALWARYRGATSRGRALPRKRAPNHHCRIRRSRNRQGIGCSRSPPAASAALAAATVAKCSVL